MFLVISTLGKLNDAEKIANILLEEKLIACANIIPDVKSFFYWNQEKQETGEVILLLKTDKEKFSSLVKRLKELHPYELPEIIGIPVNYGLPEYLTWIKESVG
ncbi:MAG TPA: divalent-cation tolerance protein CutA [Dictyoglomaceae bacterium]|nr:divalent-cation tolerance protein CutA [Dictyoglomaceae bacterium]